MPRNAATPTPATQTLAFADYQLHAHARRLLKGGQAQRIGERAFDLLCLLASPPPQFHRAEALRRAVWGKSDFNQSNLRVQIVALRRLLGNDAISYHGSRGYRFELPVRPVGDATSEPDAAPTPLGNLPDDLPGLWGRDALLQQLAAQVPATRLLTLKGPGGAGKTALALAAARAAAPAFADGAWLVDLAPLASGTLLLGAVAAALNRVLPEAQPLAALGTMLSTQRLLLVLDNCEHLPAAVATLCDHLLRHAPQVHLLCTSRVALKAAGETLLEVGPLDLPDTDDWPAVQRSGAVALFEARVKAVDARFRLTAANLHTVLDICRRLDGLAYALVLAAAHVPVLGLGGLRDRLDDRLSWERRAGHDAQARHLSLQATLDWSHNLLTADAQRVLHRLGVFAGSFALDAVLQVVPDETLSAAAVLKALQTLVDHSLLAVEASALLGSGDTPARYTLHEAVRLDARQRLAASGLAPRLHDAHAAYFRSFSRRLSRTAARAAGKQPQVLADLDNLRAAIAWSLQHHPALAMALVADCCFTWRKLGLHAEARSYVNTLLALPAAPDQAVTRADLLVGLCAIDFEHEALDAVYAGADAALQLLQGQDERPRAAHALAWQAAVHLQRMDLDRAEAMYRQVLAECRSAGDELGVRDTLNNLGFALQAQGSRLPEARAALLEAASMHTQAGDEWGLLMAEENLGELELAADQPAQAARHHENAVLAARRIHHQYRLAHNLNLLGLAQRQLAQLPAAKACLHESLQISTRLGLERLQVDACTILANTLLACAAADKALALVQAARQLYRKYGLKLFPNMQAVLDATETAAMAALPAQAQHAARAQGDILSLHQAQRWALD